MTSATQTKSQLLNGSKLPVPPPRLANVTANAMRDATPPTPPASTTKTDRGVTSPAPKPADVSAIVKLPAGTTIDGIDCGGMFDDPKKSGVPVYLQSQNRAPLTDEQKKRIAELKKATHASGAKPSNLTDADKAAIKELKAAGADKVSVVKQHGAKLKSETSAKPATAKKTSTTKVKSNKPAKSEAPRKPGDRARYDWNGAREAAAKGKIPAAPDFSANTHRSYRAPLAEVEKLVKARDLAGLQAYRVKGSSTSPAAIKRYREIAIIALKAK